jgi:hypothetical protein
MALSATHNDVLGWASSPEPAELSPFKPKLSWALKRAYNRLELGFKYQKPKPGLQYIAVWHAEPQLDR